MHEFCLLAESYRKGSAIIGATLSSFFSFIIIFMSLLDPRGTSLHEAFQILSVCSSVRTSALIWVLSYTANLPWNPNIFADSEPPIKWPLGNPSLKDGCTPKIWDHGNWKGHFSYVTKEVIKELISLGLVGRSLSSSTQKALQKPNVNFSLI